jgi:hypothetical protein
MQPRARAVAHRHHHRDAVCGFALIGATLLVHYSWAWVPAADQARVWNIAGAAGRLALLAVVAVLVVAAYGVRSRILAAGWLWWVAEELLTIGCNGALLYAPRWMPPGASACQSLLQIEWGRIGALVAALLLVPAVRSYRCANDQEQ